MPSYDSEYSDEEYAELNAAINKSASGPIVTKWVLIMEIIDNDGDRSMESRNSLECAPWDELGLLAHRTAYVKAGIDRAEDD